jgi:hypothetical protein
VISLVQTPSPSDTGSSEPPARTASAQMMPQARAYSRLTGPPSSGISLETSQAAMAGDGETRRTISRMKNACWPSMKPSV